MGVTIDTEEQGNYEIWRECISEPVIRRLAVQPTRTAKRRSGRDRKTKPGRRSIGSKHQKLGQEPGKSEEKGDGKDVSTQNDAEELGDFIDYIASEVFLSLPEEVKKLSYGAVQSDSSLEQRYASPLDPSTVDALLAPIPITVTESLVAYNLIDDDSSESLVPFLGTVLTNYVDSVVAPPPVWSNTRTAACEICNRDWVTLTYHHLIPRSTHVRVLKRGWHKEWELNRVAWLCRACHSFVHKIDSEELATTWHTVELLKSREDIQRWAEWVGRVRWKAK